VRVRFRHLAVAAVVLALTAGAATLRAAFVVVPNGLEAAEGNSNNGFPFDINNPRFCLRIHLTTWNAAVICTRARNVAASLS
jgi:hypothetical protein